MGTPSFMAPEQARGQQALISPATDIYALGAILYNILALRPPVEAKSIQQLLLRIVKGEITPPSALQTSSTAAAAKARKQKPGRGAAADAKVAGLDQLSQIAARATKQQLRQRRDAHAAAKSQFPHCPNGRIPGALSAVSMKALAIEPANRYPSVVDLQADIDAYLGGFATRAEDAGLWRQLCLLVHRHKAVFGTAAAALLVIVAGTALFVVRITTARNEAVAQRQRAEDTLVALNQEQQARQAEQKQAAPAFVGVARKAIMDSDVETAMTTVSGAIALDPSLPEAWLLHFCLHLHDRNYDAAIDSMLRYGRLVPRFSQGRELRDQCRLAQRNEAEVARWFIDFFNAQGLPTLTQPFIDILADDDMQFQAYLRRIQTAFPGSGLGRHMRLSFSNPKIVTDLRPLKGIPLKDISLVNAASVSDLSPLEGMPLESLNIYRSSVSDLTTLKGMPLEFLAINGTDVSDLTPLQGMTLKRLQAGSINISDLSPLQGMPLEFLEIHGTGVSDLTPLKNMALKWLRMNGTQISDLAPLKGMPLEYLAINNTSVSDLNPLKGMPLTLIRIDVDKIKSGMETLRAVPTLKTINNMPAAEFWRQYDAGEFGQR